MNKRIMSALLGACMAVALLPTVSLAADEPTSRQNAEQVIVAGTVLTDGMGWDNDGTTTENGSQDNNVYFKDGVLYLNDAEVETWGTTIFVSSGSVTVDVSGENLFVSTSTEDSYDAIVFNTNWHDETAGDVVIQGDGTLEAYSKGTAIHNQVEEAPTNMTIRDVELILEATGASRGIYSNSLHICGEAQVIIESGYDGIEAKKLSVSDDAFVYAESVCGEGYSGAALRSDAIDISGGYVAAYGDYDAVCGGGDHITVNGGILEAYSRYKYGHPALHNNFSAVNVITTGMQVKAGISALDAEPVTDYDANAGSSYYSYALIAPSLDDLIWENPFTDIDEGAWYYDHVAYVNEYGLMAGTAVDTFTPLGKVSRAQAVQMMYNISGNYPRQYGLFADEPAEFADVPADAWYAEAVGWGGATGVVSGTGNGKFAPNSDVTREQFAVILHNYAGKLQFDTSVRASLDGFNDADTISGWAEDAMQWTVGAKVMSGTNNGDLNPQGTLTRAEAAAMLRNFISATLEQTV